MTAERAAWWSIAFTANAILIGLAPGFPYVIAPAVVQLGLAWWFAVDTDTTRTVTEAEHEATVELLHEVLAEHGPMECDPDCGCSACRAWAHLRWIEGREVNGAR